jgi:ABC-type molybdate transport system substrate-binding protein
MQEVGTFILAPLQSYPPINQCAVVMKNSKQAATAHDFLSWLLSKPIQEKLRDFGLAPAGTTLH